jgi:hypothetical protein
MEKQGFRSIPPSPGRLPTAGMLRALSPSIRTGQTGQTGENAMEDFTNLTAAWIDGHSDIVLEIGCLVSAASEWTEDEMELDDLVCGLVESGSVQLQIG